MISFLVIFPTLLSIIALILSGLEILRCFRYKCLQFGFISVILAFDDGDFNRYDGDRISHKAGTTMSRHENYGYIFRLPSRGWYNQWRMHKATGWQCKAPGAHSRKSEHFRRNLSAAACMDYDSLATAYAKQHSTCTRKYKKVTLEEILALQRVWITLRQQRGNCLKPEGLSFDTLLK